MKVEIKIEPECKENKIIIITYKITDEIQKILSMISQEDKKIQ